MTRKTTKKSTKKKASKVVAKKSTKKVVRRRRTQTTKSKPQPQLKGGRTLVSLVLDETGSMSNHLTDTISSVNEYVKSLQGQNVPEMLYTLTKFNSTKVEVVQSSVPISTAIPLTTENYKPAATTPLYDAVGRTIKAIDEDLRMQASKPAVLVIIVTDGQENASKEYSREQVYQLIQEREKQGWKFVYLGSDHDVWAAGASLGISLKDTVSYRSNDYKGTMRKLSEATVRYSTSVQTMGADVASRASLFTEDEKRGLEGI